MTHTYRAMDGYETQGLRLAESSGGSAPTVETTLASYSYYGARWNLSAGSGFARYGSGFNSQRRWLTNQIPFWWVSYHFYLSSLPTAGLFYYLGRYNSNFASGEAGLRLQSDGTLQIYNDNTATWATGSGTLSTGKRYIVSFLWRRNVQIRAVIRDAESFTTIVDVAHGSAPRDRDAISFDVGPYTTSTGDLTFDNYVEENDATFGNIDDPVNDLGTKAAVGMLIPNAVGSYDAWTGTFADIDEYPPDADTTARTSTVDTQAFTNGLTKSSSLAKQVGTIKAVEGFIVMRSGAATENGEIRFRSGATNVDGADADVPSGYTDYHVFTTADPATSSPWTVSAIDAVEIGAVRGPGAGTVRVTEAGVNILYITETIDRQRKANYVFDGQDRRRRIFSESGRALLRSEVRSNRWTRSMSVALPNASRPASAIDQDDMNFNESTVYNQDESGIRLNISGSPDDFLEMLLRRMQNLGGAV